MAKKILQLINHPYRATLEEQDDTVLWLTHSLATQGAELSVVLQHGAVHYAIARQNAHGLKIGNWQQENPPDIVADLKALITKKIAVYYIREDFVSRGLTTEELIPDLKAISRSDLATLMTEHDLVWSW